MNTRTHTTISTTLANQEWGERVTLDATVSVDPGRVGSTRLVIRTSGACVATAAIDVDDLGALAHALMDLHHEASALSRRLA